MKYLIALMMIITVGCNAETTTSKERSQSNVQSAQSSQALEKLNEKEEDCDKKAEKKIEIKEESINLLGGNTGCTLE
jgi:hypothetical protein